MLPLTSQQLPAAVADLRVGGGGAQGRSPLPLGQNFFIFMQLSRKFCQIVSWRPPWGLVSPPLENPGSATELNKSELCYSSETNGGGQMVRSPRTSIMNKMATKGGCRFHCFSSPDFLVPYPLFCSVLRTRYEVGRCTIVDYSSRVMSNYYPV